MSFHMLTVTYHDKTWETQELVTIYQFSFILPHQSADCMEEKLLQQVSLMGKNSTPPQNTGQQLTQQIQTWTHALQHPQKPNQAGLN